MEIKINVPAEKFNEILEKELDGLTQEEIKQIVVEGIKKQCFDSDLIKRLFVKSNDGGYYGVRYPDEPTPLLEKLVKEIDVKDQLQEIYDEIVKVIKNDIFNIIKNMFIDAIVNGLTTNNYLFDGSLKRTIRETVMEMKNNNGY